MPIKVSRLTMQRLYLAVAMLTVSVMASPLFATLSYAKPLLRDVP